MPRSANQALLAGMANEANARNIARQAAENEASEARRYGNTGSVNSFLSADSNMSNLTGSAAAGNSLAPTFPLTGPQTGPAPVPPTGPSSLSLWQQVLAPSNTPASNLRVRRSATPRRPSVAGLFSGGRKSRRQTNRRRSHKK